MKTILPGVDKASEEAARLRHILDQSYTRIRERARSEWERQKPDYDPADACVTVRIGRRDRSFGHTLRKLAEDGYCST